MKNIEDKIYVPAGYAYDGGSLDNVAYFSLASFTWEEGPSWTPVLPLSTYGGHLMVSNGSLTFFGGQYNKKIFKLVEKVWLSYNWFEWQEAGQVKTK